MTFEAFVRGLTVSLSGVLVGGKVFPGITIHQELASGTITKTKDARYDGSL